jgi:hypothetical protein
MEGWKRKSQPKKSALVSSNEFVATKLAGSGLTITMPLNLVARRGQLPLAREECH